MNEVVEYKRKHEIQLIAREDMSTVGDEIGAITAKMKLLKQQEKDLREALLKSMLEYNVDKWVTEGGTQITIVRSQDKMVDEFDFDTFAKENPLVVEHYTKPTLKIGKEPYLKITPPKD